MGNVNRQAYGIFCEGELHTELVTARTPEQAVELAGPLFATVGIDLRAVMQGGGRVSVVREGKVSLQ